MTDSYDQLDDFVRQHDHDRWVLSLFAPDAMRPHILALLAFNWEIARIRDLVSEPMVGQVRLGWWRESIQDMQHGNVRKHFVLQALATIPNLEYATLEKMIDARLREMDEVINPNWDDFMNYCHNTSGLLWGLCSNLYCHPERSEGSPAASLYQILRSAQDDKKVKLGQAWAMIGIVRSIAYNARFRRNYLPNDLLAKHNLDIGRFFDVPSRVDLSPVCQEIVEAAESILDQFPPSEMSRMDRALVKLSRIYIKRQRKAGFNPLDPWVNAPVPFQYWRLLLGG